MPVSGPLHHGQSAAATPRASGDSAWEVGDTWRTGEVVVLGVGSEATEIETGGKRRKPEKKLWAECRGFTETDNESRSGK